MQEAPPIVGDAEAPAGAMATPAPTTATPPPSEDVAGAAAISLEGLPLLVDAEAAGPTPSPAAGTPTPSQRDAAAVAPTAGGGLAPLLVDAGVASRMLGCGRTLFLQMHATGRLGPLPIRLGRRLLWRVAEITHWVAARCPPRDRWKVMNGT